MVYILMNSFERYYDQQSNKDFINLQHKVLEALKSHPRVLKENLYVVLHNHPMYGMLWEIEGNLFIIQNNGVEASFKRVQ